MTAAIIQARMNSSRLPGKVLKKAAGKPVLGYLIERLKKIPSCNKIIIAATVNPMDQPIEQFAQENGIPIFRGSEEDVLDRYIRCAEAFGVQTIIRSCADSPFIEPDYINYMIQALGKNEFDYCSGNPDLSIVSTGVEVFSFDALKRQLEMNPDKTQREHVSLLMRQNEGYKKCYIQPEDKFIRDDIRLTIDTEADFLLFRSITEHFKGNYFSLSEVLRYLDENPDLKNINSHIKQKDVRLPSFKIALVVSGIDKDVSSSIKKVMVEKYFLGIEIFFVSPDNPSFDWAEFSEKLSHFHYIYYDSALNNMTFDGASEAVNIHELDPDYLAVNAKKKLGFE